MFVEFASFISPLVQLSKLLLLLLVRISLCFCKATLPLGRVDHWMLGWGAESFSLVATSGVLKWELQRMRVLHSSPPWSVRPGDWKACWVFRFPPSVPLSNSSDVLLLSFTNTLSPFVFTPCVKSPADSKSFALVSDAAPCFL